MSQVRPIEDLFAELVELNTFAERETYLKGVCGDDVGLRSRLEKLLAANEKAGSFFQDGPGVEATIDLGVDSKLVGSIIGPYKIREIIGEGGMGTVYVAEQDKPLRRKVALKVIRAGMDSTAVLARFEAERNVLAMMNHPNIAKVLDAGATDQGRPYFAMELVSGIPITNYCDEHTLSIDQRLELFMQVCHAIQHAHQKGIIHRDIKPANVLVTELDGKPIPKVIDFGIAKALNQSLTECSIYTSFQSVIGTPLYMSPEQASLSAVDVDTRSDVYSLGVLLYELLTSTTPFEQSKFKEAAQHEVLRIIREDEPPRPSNRISTLGETATRTSQLRCTQPDRLGRKVKGDLDWIVMTALDKERTRRYETASSFAADIGRYLDNSAIEARPPSTWYRLSKSLYRHRIATMTSSLILMTLVLGLGAALWGLSKASSERKKFEELLARYEPLVLDQIFDDIFCGDELAERALADAELVGVASGRLSVLRGLKQVFSGNQESYVKGMQTFERMLAENPDDVMALSVFAWAHSTGYSDQDALAEVFARQRIAEEPKRDHEKVIWAAGLGVGGGFGSISQDVTFVKQAVDTLEKVSKRNPSWNLPRLLLARILSDFGLDSGDPSRILEATVHLEKIRDLNPSQQDSPFWLSQRLHVNSIAARMSSGEDRVRYQTTAEQLATKLEQFRSNVFGRLERALYFTNAAEMDGAVDFDRAINEWHEFNQYSDNDYYRSLFSGLLIRVALATNNWTEANQYHSQVGLPFAAYFRGDREKLLTYRTGHQEQVLMDAFWTHASYFACGGKPREAAISFFRSLRDKSDVPPWIELPLQLYLGDVKPEEVTPSASRRRQAWAYTIVGNYLMDVGRTQDAEEYFDKAIAVDYFDGDTHQWAHAFKLLAAKDQDWYRRLNPRAAKNDSVK